MPYFKDTNNELHFLDDVSFAHLLPAGCVQITDAEAATIQAAQLAALPKTPDPAGFAQAVKSGVGGILAANALMVAYPAFFPAIQTGAWADLQALIVDAKTKSILTTAQYSGIKAAAASFNIPVTLP